MPGPYLESNVGNNNASKGGVVPPPVSPTQEVEAEGVSLKPVLGYIVSKLQGNMNKNNKQTKNGRPISKINPSIKKINGRIKGRKA